MDTRAKYQYPAGGPSDHQDPGPVEEQPVEIKVVSCLTGDDLATLQARPGDSVAQLKVRLWEVEGTPAHAQRLCLRDRVLDNEEPVGTLPQGVALSFVRIPFDPAVSKELQRAVECRMQEDFVLSLLEDSADPNARDPTDDWSVLHEAAAAGLRDTCSMLLDLGARPSCMTTSGATPLLVASQSGHVKVVQELIGRRAQVELARDDGASPLLVAAMGGHWAVAEELRAAGASVDLPTSNGATPLLVASEAGHLQMVKGLLAARAAVEQPGPCGVTPLLAAAARGRKSVVLELLESRAEINVTMTGGITPLHAASQEGHLAVVEALLERGAVADALNCEGCTALFLAAQEGHVEVAHALLCAGADVDLPAGDKATPLLTASQRAHYAVARHLLQRGANVNSRMPDGTTPLVAAAHSGADDVCRLLLDARADTGAEAKDNPIVGSGTAVEVALRNGHLTLVELLGGGSNRQAGKGLEAAHCLESGRYDREAWCAL